MPTKYLLNLVSDRLRTLPLVVLYLTDGCNSRCITCDIWRNPRRNMAMETVEAIASQAQDLQVRWVLLSGGEAMQHPQWPEIARRFRSEGVYVMLLTNGLLLRKQAAEVISSVDEVIVSLDGGTAETYATIRGVDAFDLVLEGIGAVRAGGVPVATRTTVQRANFREIPRIIETAKAAGVTQISFLTVDVSNEHAFGPRFVHQPSLLTPQSAGREDKVIPTGEIGTSSFLPDHQPMVTALTRTEVLELVQVLDRVEEQFAADFASGLIAESPEKLRQMVDYFGAINGENPFRPPRCNAPHINIVIEVDGSLRPCYFLPASGTLKNKPLNEAINTPNALALRRAYRTGQRPECERCVCPLYKGPRALLSM